METNGVDAIGVIPGVRGLVCLDMKILSVPPSAWDELSAAAVSERLARVKMQDTVLMKSQTESPPTWLFQTRKGDMGILQIAGFTENLSGIRIRSKLIQNQGVATATDERAAALQFRLVAPAAGPEPIDVLTNADNANDPREFRVLREILLDGSAVSQAGIKFDADARRSIWVQFTESGARRFEEITASNIDRQIAIVYHGAVLTAPFIRTKIPGGQISIPGPQSLKEVQAIVDSLNRTVIPTDEAWTFTKPRERLLVAQTPPSFSRGWLDLDSGILATNNNVDWETRRGNDWISTNHFDLVATISEHRYPMLIGFDIVVEPLPTNAWVSLTPADVVQSWALKQSEPKQNLIFGTAPGKPDTFLLQTREGGKGILQILGVAENGRDVRLRYKLVQSRRNPN